MKTRVQRWGNSLAVRIPKAFATELDIAADDVVDVFVGQGVLVVEPVRLVRERLDLAQLLREIPADYVAEDVDWGPPVGREVW
jgi:antitoxin MazE